MRLRRLGLQAMGFLILPLAATACHGGAPSGAYLPASGDQMITSQQRLASSDVPDLSRIRSTCGTSLKLTAGAKATCRFSEAHYAGMFTVTPARGAHVKVSPTRGTSKTKFVFTATSAGKQRFVVRDRKGRTLSLAFNVTRVQRGGAIDSSCGNDISITLAGAIDCQFKQTGFSGTFTVTNNLNGIATITPTSGTSATTFTVLGLITGGGNFVVHGGNKKTLTVKVSVGL